MDTPGQIEVFTWSASGSIVTDALASLFRTVVIYVVDTTRAASPATFMSNMLYACSIMYKSKLPFILVFNKTDVTHHKFAVEWMSDYDSFSVRSLALSCSFVCLNVLLCLLVPRCCRFCDRPPCVLMNLTCRASPAPCLWSSMNSIVAFGYGHCSFRFPSKSFFVLVFVSVVYFTGVLPHRTFCLCVFVCLLCVYK